MKRFLVIMLAFLLLLNAGCGFIAQYIEDEPVVTDAPVRPDESTAPVVTEAPEEPAETAVPTEPQAKGDLVFDTVTLYGEPISSDMLKDYDLVLVNFWADWCGWCVYEMPELERIHQEYPNVLLLGVLSFPNSMEDSKKILEENNITFLTLEPNGTLVNMANGLEAFPTTYFFDRSGNSIGEPVVGAQDYNGWKATVDGLLAGGGTTPTEPTEPQAQGDLVFDTVTVFGEPISTEILHEYDLVMVNFWAEWCGPCVGELPELERIHQEYPNVLLLGVLTWSDDMAGAKAIMSDTGVSYPVLSPAGTLPGYIDTFEGIPTTMFFDSRGNLCADPILGSRSYEEWKTIVEDLLP